jgi:hypothetical protein
MSSGASGTGGVGPADDFQQATAGGRTLPRAPHFAACCQAGRRREASSGLFLVSTLVRISSHNRWFEPPQLRCSVRPVAPQPWPRACNANCGIQPTVVIVSTVEQYSLVADPKALTAEDKPSATLSDGVGQSRSGAELPFSLTAGRLCASWGSSTSLLRRFSFDRLPGVPYTPAIFSIASLLRLRFLLLGKEGT